MNKRLLIGLVVLCLTLVLIPTMVLAVDRNVDSAADLTDAVESADTGDVIRITDHIILTETLVIPYGKEIVLDLNGNTISGTSVATENYELIKNNGKLTVKDSIGTGKIEFTYTGGSSGWGYYSNTITNCGTLTVKSGSIVNATNVASHIYFAIDNNSTLRDTVLNIERGTVSCPNYRAIRQFANSKTLINEINISGGTITGASGNAAVWMQQPTTNSMHRAGINISGGTVQGVYLDFDNFSAADLTDDLYSPVRISISGGEFTGAVKVRYASDSPAASCPGFIVGGTFVNDISDYEAPGNESEYTNGVWVVTASADAIAQVGSAGYMNLADAVTAVKESGTIKLLNNFVMSTSDIVTIPEDKTVTLNLNGKSITVTEDFQGRTIENLGTLTVTGNGTIDTTNATMNWNGLIDNYGTLTIENGTFRSPRSAEAVGIWVRTNATAAFRGGVYEDSATIIRTAAGSDTTISGGSYTNNAYAAIDNGGEMLITGGTFVNTSCSICDRMWGYTVRNGVDNVNAHLVIAESSPGLVQVTGVQGALANSSGLTEVQSGSFRTVACAVHGGGSAYYALYVAGEHAESKCIVSGGTFRSFSKTAVSIGNDNTDGDGGINEKATSEIKGGTFIAPDGVKAVTGAALTGTPIISGGNFSSSVDEGYLDDSITAELYSAAKDGEAPYSYYPNISDALRNASPGDTVKNLLVTDNTVPRDLVTLIYDNETDESITVKVMAGSRLDLPKPKRTGYVFIGWFDGKDRLISYTAEGGVEITLTAKWKPLESDEDKTAYTLTFNTNGGSTIEALSMPFGTKINLSTYLPVKSGYAFAGWYSDSSLTTKLSSLILTSDVTVYAKWIEVVELPFTDIDHDNWYYADVAFVYAQGLMKGTDNTTFSPGLSTTRGMIVAMLYRLEGLPAVTCSCPFTDVSPSVYYEDAITWAAANDLIEGYGNDIFGPNHNITREQLATILFRYAEYKGYEVTDKTDLSRFPDSYKACSYAVDALGWATANGLIEGKVDNLLDPKGNALRCEVAAVFHRFCEIFNK